MSHTPAPWKVRFFRKEEPDRGFFIEAKNPNLTVGHNIEIMGEDFGDHNGYTLDMRLADACLIAAAPDLLAACKQLINAPHYEHFAARLNDEEMKGIDLIKIAIKNAEWNQA